MVFWPPYPWYFDPPTHGILIHPWYIDPPTHGILTPYLWYIEPLTHGISTPLSMVFWPPPPTHRMSTPYTWYFDLPAYLLIRNGGGGQNTMRVQFTIQGGSVFNKGVQYTMDVNWPRVQLPWGSKYHMTPVVNYKLMLIYSTDFWYQLKLIFFGVK